MLMQTRALTMLEQTNYTLRVEMVSYYTVIECYPISWALVLISRCPTSGPLRLYMVINVMHDQSFF